MGAGSPRRESRAHPAPDKTGTAVRGFEISAEMFERLAARCMELTRPAYALAGTTAARAQDLRAGTPDAALSGARRYRRRAVRFHR